MRRPDGPFGWLPARLLHEGWLSRLGPEATAILLLLALAADQHGASFHGRERMGERLGMERSQVDGALSRLLELDLVAHRPWRHGGVDGVWQLLPVSGQRDPHRGGTVLSVGAILDQLGLQP
jgi:hypothetical protein